MKSYEKFISKESVKKIHNNSLRILEEVGVKFENEKALQIFKDNGATVDGTVVRIPSHLVEDAIKLSPQTLELKSNNFKNLTLGDNHDKMITCNCGNIYIDDNGIRKVTNEDIINQFKLSATSKICTYPFLNAFADESRFTKEQKIFSGIAMRLRYANSITFSSGAITRSMPEDEANRHTKKGIQLIRDFEGISDKSVPVYIEGVNALSPMAFDHEPINKLFCACDENQPIWITPCAMPLLTAPESVAGLMSTTNAEVLAGLTLMQLYKPGHPFIYGNVSGSTNMRYIQLSIGSPEAALIAYSTAGLADLYELPFRVGGALSDAKDLDSQAGAEAQMMIYATLDTNADFIMHMAGTMGSYNIVSFEKFILDEEIVGMVQRLLKGIDVTDETLLLNRIKKVGPRGSYLTRTPKMFRNEFYNNQLFNKDDPNNWKNNGEKSIKEVAKEEVQRRLLSYVIPERTKEQLELLTPYLPDQYKEKI